MPKATVQIFDENNNVVSEIPYGQGGITGTVVNDQRQQVYQDTDKEGNRVFVAAENFSDPFLKIGNEIDRTISIQAPKIAIANNKITVSAPQEVLSSPLVAQVKEELQSLKGADLSSPETQNAINALNEEVQNSIKDSMLKAATGWTRDQYNDYQYARQSVRTTNPMKSSNKIKGKDKDGNIIMKTPQEWIDYYRKFYNTDERTEAFKKSFMSSDPYERTMALVMGQGDSTPVYGFDTAERIGQGWKAFVNQMGKFPEGMLRLLGEDTDTRRLEGIVNNKKIPVESMRKFNVNTEDEFNAKKEALKGKSWSELSDDDKAFIAILGVSREGDLQKNADTTEAMKDYRGKKTNTFAWDTSKQDYERAERKAARQISTENLNDATSDDEEKSREAINEILSDNSFEKYRTARNNYDTWQGYQDWTEEGEKELASTADWSGSEQWWGNLAGTMGRYLWENAVVQGATGGFAMNAVSDKIGAHIVGKLAQNGIAPTSAFGRNAMQFTANLIGTIPEDILQTSVDNVLTYNIKDNTALLNPEQMSENFRNNLIFMAGFNTIRAGLSAVKRARLAKQIAKAADLDEELVIGKFADADDVARAASKGQEIKVDGDKVSTVDVDGNETVLKNTTPEQGEMIRRSLLGDTATPVEVVDVLKPGDKIQFQMRYEAGNQWSNGEIIEEGGRKYIISDDMDSRLPADSPTIGLIRTIDGSPITTSVREPADYGTAEYINRDKTKSDLTYERSLERQKANDLEEQKQKWIDEREEYKKSGFDDPSTIERYDTEINRIDTEIDSVKNRIQQLDEAIAKAPDADTQSTVRVEVDTPDGPVRTETVDYTFSKIDDATTPGIKIENTPAGVKHWHTKALDYITNLAQDKLFREFRTRFGDITTSEFDWIFHNSKNGMTPDQIIGTVDPVSGRTITQNTIDAAKWWADNPIVQKLRMGSRKSLGLEGDVNILGYLPHTNYDPANLSYDEALTGQLWQEYTGKSTVGDDGKFIGYGGTFDGRFRTYASNMLWDIRGKEVAAAKLIEEAQMEGKTLTPEQAIKAVEGGRNIQAKVNDAPSTKALTKELSSDSGYDKKVYEDIDKKIKEEAPKSGLSKAYHDNYSDVYVGANGQAVQSQPDRIGSVSFTQQSDIMRDIKTRDGSMYDNGGADIVYASQNAVELVNRFTREGGDLGEMLTEFIQNHSGRSPKYAEAVADRWISKMNDGPGKLTKGKAILSLSSSMRAEGASRLRRWLVRAEYNGFNAKTRGFMDDFLFRHTQMDSIKNNRSVRGMMTKALNGLTGLRYRALFYGNIKNALLQISELNRLFTVFKWGDVGNTLKRLATDEGFRARVDTYVEAVSPETTYLDSELYGKYQQVSDSAKVDNDGITFRKLAGDAKDTADKIGLAPINAAENLKNRTMIAALVQEADRMGLSGDEALRHIRSRFERVALANNEMGRIGLASNPLAKPMLFLQNFQIRELGMHYYNIKDATGMTTSTPKRILNASKYLTKVLGSKLATTLILARLGYSASQTLGIDPFGLVNNYTGLSEDEMNAIDKQISGGVLTPFFAGGMTSLISDMYFMARAAYEDSNRQTISDEANANLDGSYGMDWGSVFSLDNAANLAGNFAPGNVFLNRIGQMNEMMDTGWATSASGNKMYTAPNDAINTLLGYLFGRSATQNAQQYQQTYGNNLLQTLGRFNPFRQYGEFDPIDTKNYSDWFSGDDNDRQQFEKGRRYFQQQRDRILDEYEDAIRKSYASNDDVAEAKNNMNQRLESLYEQLDRFVNAYERKNGTIDSAMTKQIVNLLNTGRDVLGDTPEQAQERGLEEYNKALERYSQRGYSPVGTYTGPSESQPDKEVKYQGSPQYRTAVSGKYNLNSEAVAVLKEADRVLADTRKELKQAVSDAYDAKDYDRLAEIQKQYLTSFDKAVAPVIATYGNSILSSTDVVNQLKDMLSTGTVSRSGDLIPSDQYRKDKYGRYRSMPLETVDVKKWAQQRYSDDIYKQPTVRSYTAAGDDIMDIRRLINQGKSDRARARALQLKVRVDNQKRTISSEDYSWLLDFLNNGGK